MADVLAVALPAAEARQTEFWEEPAVAVESAPLKAPWPVPEPMQAGMADKTSAVFDAEPAEKGRTMNPLAKATFLRIGGALYDGSDEGRWFSLPARKHTVPVQYMRAPEAAAEVRRDGALSGRQDVDHADGA